MGAASSASPQSLNLYAYVQSSPTDFVDPDGLDRTVDKAVSQAQELLKNPACAALFGGANAAKNLAEMAQNIHIVEQRPTYTQDKQGNVTQTGSTGFGNNIAFTLRYHQTLPSGRKQYVAQGIYIDQNGQFFSGSGLLTIYEAIKQHVLAETRNVMTILHELMHWNGVPGGAGHQQTFNQQIYDNCIKNNPYYQTDKPQTPGASDTIAGTGGGGDGSYGSGGYGGIPYWYWSLKEFLDEIDSIEVGGGTVTVSGCVGSDCNS